MPSPSDHERLLHIQDAIEHIIEYTRQMTLVEYLQDRKTQLTVERLLEIIGEATAHISPQLKDKYPEIPWRQITDLRNVVSHEYFQVRQEIIWDVATREIPILAIQIERVLLE